MKESIDPEVGGTLQSAERSVRIYQDLLKVASHPFATEKIESSFGDALSGQPRGASLEGEIEIHGQPEPSQQPRRIIQEGFLVQNAKEARFEILETAEGIDQPRLRLPEENRHRVDAEIASKEVVFQATGPHTRQLGRAVIGLGTGSHDVYGEAVVADEIGGQKLVMLGNRASQTLCQKPS
jgi:hypothetical protein